MNDEATALTQPYLNFLTHLQEGLCEYWFEEMECESLLTINREFNVLCLSLVLHFLFHEIFILYDSWNIECLQIWKREPY